MTKETRRIDIVGCSQCGKDHKDITITQDPREGCHDKAWWFATCPETGGMIDVEYIYLSSITPIQEHEGTFTIKDAFRTGRIIPMSHEKYPYDVEIDCQLCGGPRRYRNKTLEAARERLKKATPQSTVCDQCMLKAIVANAHNIGLEDIVEELKEEWEGWL